MDDGNSRPKCPRPPSRQSQGPNWLAALCLCLAHITAAAFNLSPSLVACWWGMPATRS